MRRKNGVLLQVASYTSGTPQIHIVSNGLWDIETSAISSLWFLKVIATGKVA